MQNEVIAWLKTKNYFAEGVSAWKNNAGSPHGDCCNVPNSKE
jgi:hypothetical protein